MSGPPRAAAGLLGMVSAPAACLLLSPSLLPAALVFPVLGAVRWRVKWLAAVLAVSAAPLAVAVWFALSDSAGDPLVPLRWALSVSCGLYFAKRAPAKGIGALLRAWAGRAPAGRSLLADAGDVLSASAEIREGMRGVHPLRTKPGELVERLSRSLSAYRPSAADPEPAGPAMMAEAWAAWALLLAGVAGL
ncbi:MAG TPA: hypothetical protein P5266_00150 [Candidatus Fermentibacter sp.]|nr:hypothetical protein [Candidatus Fermentibacter sp.]